MQPREMPESSDYRMKRMYVLVFVCEAITITALWVFGRFFS